MEKRKYRQKRRAEQQEQTRQRIIDAAVELHGELGPRLTSVKAVAERANVERLTVYRHFPDQYALFEACSGVWLESNPLPGFDEWLRITDASSRAKAVLADLYRYYAGTATMWRLSWRDREEVPALEPQMQKVDAYLDAAAKCLLEDGTPGTSLALATAIHLVQFQTWAMLEAQGLPDQTKVLLALRWLGAARDAED